MFSIILNGILLADGAGHTPRWMALATLHSTTPLLSASIRLASASASPSKASIHSRAGPSMSCSARLRRFSFSCILSFTSSSPCSAADGGPAAAGGGAGVGGVGGGGVCGGGAAGRSILLRGVKSAALNNVSLAASGRTLASCLPAVNNFGAALASFIWA
eukprot:6892438-Prymnesium_polylepis.1